MSEILKPLMTDETGRAIVEALTQQDMTQTRIEEINTASDTVKREITELTNTSKQSIETKTNEQLARIPEVTELSGDVGQLKSDLKDLDKAINNITDKPRSVIVLSVESFIMFNAQTDYTLSIPSTDAFSYYHADYNNHYYGFIFPTKEGVKYKLSFSESVGSNDSLPQCLIMTNYNYPNRPDTLSNDFVVHSFITVNGDNTCEFIASGKETVLCFKQMYDMHTLNIDNIRCLNSEENTLLKRTSLPLASTEEFGVVKVGRGLTIEDGEISASSSYIDIITPVIYAVHGVGNFEVYNDGIANSDIDDNQYNLNSTWSNVIDASYQGTLGKTAIVTNADAYQGTLRPEVRFCPKNGIAITIPNALTVRYANKPTITGPLNVLFIGDSLIGDNVVSHHEITRYFKNLMSGWGYDINLLGRDFDHENNDATNRFEARGGYAWPNYTLNPSALPSGYPNNYFWNPTTNKLDIGYYFSTYCGGVSPDYIICNVGWNHRVNPAYYNNYTLDDIENLVKIWLNAVHSDYPNCRIILNGMHYGNPDYPYPTKQYREYAISITNLYNKIANLSEYLSYVKYCDIAPYFDGREGMQFGERTNRFSGKTEKYQLDFIHPETIGYRQHAFADAMCLLFDYATK